MLGFNGAMPTPINSNSAQGIRDTLNVPSKTEMEAAIAQSTANIIKEITWTTNEEITIAAHSIQSLTDSVNVGLPVGARILAIHLLTYNQLGTQFLIPYRQQWYSHEYIAAANPTDTAITLPAGVSVRILYTLL